MIKTWKEIKNLKNLAIELQKVMKKKKKLSAQKKLRSAAALMYEPPLIDPLFRQQKLGYRTVRCDVTNAMTSSLFFDVILTYINVLKVI